MFYVLVYLSIGFVDVVVVVVVVHGFVHLWLHINLLKSGAQCSSPRFSLFE